MSSSETNPKKGDADELYSENSTGSGTEAASGDTSLLSRPSVAGRANRRRLRAPRENRSVFSGPPLSEVDGLIDANRGDPAADEYDCQGRSLAKLRRQTRRQALEEAERYTSQWRDIEPSAKDSSDLCVIAAGHQPELFHPGVWAKNFVLDHLAARRGAAALHLVVDNDTIKTTTLRIPSGTADRPALVPLAFDTWESERPWEELRVRDEALFKGFGRQVEAAMSNFPFKPMMDSFWQDVREQLRGSRSLSDCFAAARNRLEHRWGCNNLELPLSRLCRMEGFNWFACHVLAQLPRFRKVHNEALADYRKRNRIRSQNHPVPALAQDDDWLEAPFWVWSTNDLRRRRLFARQKRSEVQLSDGRETFAVLPLRPDGEACCAAEVLARLPARGIKLRTRALTTTLFSRLILSDLFIHGIGGAKYDELADAIIRGFFGFEPPAFLTLSATVHLPVRPFPEQPEDLRRVEFLQRDLLYNPDRHLSVEARGRDDVQSLVGQKRDAIARQPNSRTGLRRRFVQIRSCNEALQQWVERERDTLVDEHRLVQERLHANRILANREFAFCLYPEETLREFYAGIGKPAAK